MEHEWIGWVIAVVTGGISAAMACIAFWVRLSQTISKADTKATHAEALVLELVDARVEMTGKIAALEALTRTTAEALVRAEDRLARSMDVLGNKVEVLGASIIKAMGDNHGPRSNHPR